jgi:hypothetical protein
VATVNITRRAAIRQNSWAELSISPPKQTIAFAVRLKKSHENFNVNDLLKAIFNSRTAQSSQRVPAKRVAAHEED